MGRVAALFSYPAAGGGAEALESASAIEQVGFEGDAHARPGHDRQVLLVGKYVLDDLGLQPGQLRENVTISGLDVDALRPGDLVRLGSDVAVQVTKPCQPCYKMDLIRAGLQSSLAGRRGTLGRVVTGGVIGVGDEVSVVFSRPV